jgi:hypothetical protein
MTPYPYRKREVEQALITRAIELIEHGWTRRADARNKRAVSVSATDPAAASYCISGAFSRAASELDNEDPIALCRVHERVREVIRDELGRYSGVALFNDTHARSKQHVLKVLRATLAH